MSTLEIILSVAGALVLLVLLQLLLMVGICKALLHAAGAAVAQTKADKERKP